MASVRFGAGVAEIKGSVGGVTFQGGPNGAIIRTRTKPVNRRTAAKSLRTLNMAVYSQKWRGLTNQDRQAWIDDAPLHPYTNRLGATAYYTGYQWFMKTNLILETAAGL